MIIISQYNPKWPEEFENIKSSLQAALGDLALRIDHIGSTSVPGLGAKDVIDIQITVKALVPIHLVLLQDFLLIFEINKQKKLELARQGVVPLSVIFVQDVLHPEHANVISLIDVSQKNQVLLCTKDNHEMLLW